MPIINHGTKINEYNNYLIINVRPEVFTGAEDDKIFLGISCQFIKNYGHFRNHLCSHHQGLMADPNDREQDGS